MDTCQADPAPKHDTDPLSSPPASASPAQLVELVTEVEKDGQMGEKSMSYLLMQVVQC